MSLGHRVVELFSYTFSASCSSGLLAKFFFFFTFVLSENVLVLPLFLKNMFAEYRILGWLYFRHFKDVALFWPPLFQMSSILETFPPLYIKHCFSLDAFMIF